MKDLLIKTNTVPQAAVVENAKDKVNSNDKTFGTILKTSLSEVHQLQNNADKAIANAMLGGTGSIHEAMIAMEKAGISFHAVTAVRNKVLEAYQEVMRMQV
jgi:flagellar hook-basal body complex protein FliE